MNKGQLLKNLENLENLIDEAGSNSPVLIDITAAAQHIGVGVGVIRSWVRDGLPFVRGGRGGKKLFTRRDLERWIERLKETNAA